jgi:integrase
MKLPKGVRAVHKRLADGSTATYYYHRGTGTRLPSPSDPTFGKRLAEVKPKVGRYPPGTLGALTLAYRASPEWRAKKPRTQDKQLHYIRPLEKLHHLMVRDVKRAHVLAIRDKIAEVTGPQAANAFAQLATSIFAWARDRGWIDYSPLDRIKSIPGGHWPAWTDEQADEADRRLPEHLRRAVILARYTGQRRGDLIRMPWSAYDGRTIKVRQEKTGAELVLPVHVALKAELDAWRRTATSTLILTTASGVPWLPTHLSNALARGLAVIGLPDKLNVHGLRKLAATALAEAGCSPHEIASVTGHKSLAMVALYTASARQQQLAEAAITRLETATVNRRKPTV